MKVKVLEEAGHDNALRGMAYSYKDRALDPDSWWEGQREKANKRAPLLAPMGDGHNKFIRQITLWLDIEAPRCWWSEFDTYKIGTVADSESTMHTLGKRSPTPEDFEEDTPEYIIEAFQAYHHHWKDADGKNIAKLKCALPEGYLQRRIVTMNYEVLRNIIVQRTKHRLRYWDMFIDAAKAQVEHPEYLAENKP